MRVTLKKPVLDLIGDEGGHRRGHMLRDERFAFASA